MTIKQIALINIIKNLTLLLICVLCISVGLFNLPEGYTGLITIYCLTLIYVVLYAIELKFENSISELPVEKYYYLSYGFITRKSIRLLGFLGLSIFFMLTGKGLGLLGFALLIIFVTDSVAFIYKTVKQSYCIAFFANYLFWQQDYSQKIFASQIKEMEFRYDIFYLILNDKKILTIELDKIKASHREAFKSKMIDWIIRNKIECSIEAKEKLNIQ
jgi:hypothetical protein